MMIKFEDNVLWSKSKAFGVRIVKLSRYLKKKKEYEISAQVIRSGTSIAANIAESCYAFSRSDMIYKLTTSIKEAAETRMWLEVLYETDTIQEKEYESMMNDLIELIKLLTSSINTLRSKYKIVVQ